MAEVKIIIERMRDTVNGDDFVGFRATAQHKGHVIEKTALCPERNAKLVGESNLIKLAKGRVWHEIRIIEGEAVPQFEK